MKKLKLVLLVTVMFQTSLTYSQNLDFNKVKAFEYELEDVMEMIDTSVVIEKLKEVEQEFQKNPNEINTLRLGIIHHETALNLSFLSESAYKGYAKKSYDRLNELSISPNTTKELMPYICAYKASALSLVSAETRELSLLKTAFSLFKEAVNQYGAVSYLPEFLRGSVAENLPRLFFLKRRAAKKDFQSIIDKQNQNADYANWKIMSFTYWAWANQHQGKRHRKQSLEYLNKAISLDPNYKAGRKRAEELKTILME